MSGGLGYYSFESPRRPTPHSTHGSLSTPIRNVTTQQQQPSPLGRPTNQPPLPSTSNHGNPNNSSSSSSKVWVCQNCYTRNVKALQRCALCDCIDPTSITLTTPDVATVFGSGSSPPASSSSSSPPFRYHGGSTSTDHSVYVGAATSSAAALSAGRPSSQYLSPRRFSPPSPLTGTSSTPPLSSYPPHSSSRQQPPSSLLPTTNSLQSSSSRGAVGELGYPPAAGLSLRRGDVLPPSNTTTYLLSPSRPGGPTSARGLAVAPPSPAAPVVVAAAGEPGRVSMTTTTTTADQQQQQQQPQLTASPPQRQESTAVPLQEEAAKKKDERSGSTDRNEVVEWKAIAEDLQDEVVLSRARADATQRCHLAEREVMEMELRRLREELLARDRSVSTHATPARRSRETEHGASVSNSPPGQMHYHYSAGGGRRVSQDSSISNHNHNISSSHRNETTKEREAEEEQHEGVLIEDGSPPKGERERTIPAPVVLAAASDGEMLPSVEDLDDDGHNNNHNNIHSTEAGGEIVSSLQFELEEKNSQIIDLRSEVEILREAQRKHVAQVRQWQEQSERQTQLIAELQQEKADLRVAALFHATSPALTVSENPKTDEKVEEEEEKTDPKDAEIAALQKKLDALNNELADVELERERGEQRLRRELLYLGNDFTALKEEHEKLLKRQEQEQEEHSSGEGQGSKAAAAGGGATEHEERSRPASSIAPQDHTGSDYGMSVTGTEREQFEKLVVEGRHRQEELQSALTASTAEVTELREEVDLLRVQLADAQLALTLALRELDQPPRQR